jgi:AhpD family alkylhydroperoxidase
MSRIAYEKVAAEGMQAMYGLERYAAAQVEPALYELVKLRASVVNGCAYCVDMHGFDALKNGEATQRVLLVSAWREAGDIFTERERAALALTDSVTAIADGGVPDAVWDRAAAYFSEQELSGLVFAITTINAWNRLAVTARTAPEARV